MSEVVTVSAPSLRATVKRLGQRGAYDRETVHAILDEALIAHLGVVIDGAPRVIPFVYSRLGDLLYLHGSSGNRVLRAVGEGAPVCITVSLVDGLVLARSAFHHSVNYRSVVVHGAGRDVLDPAERRRALDATVDHVVPGRSQDVRPPTEEELLRTRVVRIPLDEASAKVRTGGPIDDVDDLALPCWAGVLPVQQHFGDPLDAAQLRAGVEVPSYLVGYTRGRRNALR